MTNTMNGLAGKILRVNLTRGDVTTESLELKIVHQFLMDTGYAAKLLWDELEAGLDPLGIENKLILCTGTASFLPHYDAMLDEYYAERGWEIDTGIPTVEKLSALNLEGYLEKVPG